MCSITHTVTKRNILLNVYSAHNSASGLTFRFTIPFALATSLGLAAVALQLPISASEAGAGLTCGWLYS